MSDLREKVKGIITTQATEWQGFIEIENEDTDQIISMVLDEAIYEIKCNTDPCADITEAIKAIEKLKTTSD